MASKQIELTQGKFALVDDHDFEFLSQWKWSYATSTGYAMRTCYPTGMKGKGFTILLHRVLMGCPEEYMVDHINCDKLDNRKDNLRIATSAQNQWNKRLAINNKSGHKGINWDPVNNKWRACLNSKDKYYHIGRFDSLDDAIAAREIFIAEKHGEFARQG